jgi:hypothetical protein
VTIEEAGLRMSDGNFFTNGLSKMRPKPLPRRLDVGEKIDVYFDFPEVERVAAEKLQSGVTLTRAFVRDVEGREYFSRLPKIMKDELPIRRRSRPTGSPSS